MDNTANSPEDIFLWPNGVWCFRRDYHEYLWLSDDFEILKEGSYKHAKLLEEEQ